MGGGAAAGGQDPGEVRAAAGPRGRTTAPNWRRGRAAELDMLDHGSIQPGHYPMIYIYIYVCIYIYIHIYIYMYVCMRSFN